MNNVVRIMANLILSLIFFSWTQVFASGDNAQREDCKKMVRSAGLGAEGIFVAIYRWRLKPGMEQQFRENWAALTKLIYSTQGSLGSRLHQGEDGLWYAYAQWPSKQLWENASLKTDEASRHRSLMREAVEEDFDDILLTVTDDLLAAP